jgi:hypothetical protein
MFEYAPSASHWVGGSRVLPFESLEFAVGPAKAPRDVVHMWKPAACQSRDIHT